MDYFWGHFGVHFGTRSAQEGAKMSPRGLSRASKNQKAAFPKTLKNIQFFKVLGSRGLPREPQEAQEGSQEASKELQNLKKRDQKMDPKFSNFWNNFGAILGSILESKIAPKGDQKWDHFWNPLPPHLRGPGIAKPGIKRECCKSYWSWNYILQKKGRDNKTFALFSLPNTIKRLAHNLNLINWCSALRV